MKSAVETLSASRVKVTIEVPMDELKPSLDAAYKRIASQVNIPGFRKGKIPAQVIDQRFGRGVVLEEAANDAMSRSLAEVIVENNFIQMSRPRVETTTMDEAEGLAFTAEFDIRPEFDLPEFSSLKVVVDPAEVPDDLVEVQLTELRQRFGSLKAVERGARDGDVLTLDIKGQHDGTDVPDLTANALSYEVGDDGLLPGLDAAVRGAAADEVRSFLFTPTGGVWADKGIVVEVTVRAVRERELPAADDAFAQLASEFDTIGELREDLRARLGRVRLVEQAYQARDFAHDALMEAVKVEVPAGGLADEVEEHFADGHGDDAHRAEFEANARSGMKSRMVLDKIAETQELKVNDAELSTWLMQQAQQYGMAPDEFADQLVKAGNVQAAVIEVRRVKALSFVLERIQVVDKAGKPVDIKSVVRGDQPLEDADDEFDAASGAESFEADE